VSLFYNRKLMK